MFNFQDIENFKRGFGMGVVFTRAHNGIVLYLRRFLYVWIGAVYQHIFKFKTTPSTFTRAVGRMLCCCFLDGIQIIPATLIKPVTVFLHAWRFVIHLCHFSDLWPARQHSSDMDGKDKDAEQSRSSKNLSAEKVIHIAPMNLKCTNNFDSQGYPLHSSIFWSRV